MFFAYVVKLEITRDYESLILGSNPGKGTNDSLFVHRKGLRTVDPWRGVQLPYRLPVEPVQFVLEDFACFYSFAKAVICLYYVCVNGGYMSRERTSVVWTIGRDELQRIVNSSNYLSEVVRGLGMIHTGVSYRSLKKRLEEDSIDWSHIPKGNIGRRGIACGGIKAFDLKDVMIECSTYSTKALKRRLLRDGILKNECSLCPQKSEWNGKPLTMIMDHINGIRDDNRLENLRIVCPNCNIQLETSNGKNRIRKKCPDCGKIIRKKNERCMDCSHKISTGRITYKVDPKDRPSKEELERLISEIPMTKIGMRYGVSDNAVKKWCKGHGMVLPNKRGHWAKVRAFQTTI